MINTGINFELVNIYFKIDIIIVRRVGGSSS
jgi:hypothetical protein